VVLPVPAGDDGEKRREGVGGENRDEHGIRGRVHYGALKHGTETAVGCRLIFLAQRRQKVDSPRCNQVESLIRELNGALRVPLIEKLTREAQSLSDDQRRFFRVRSRRNDWTVRADFSGLRFRLRGLCEFGEKLFAESAVAS
jgi:hypothetical protein